MELHPEDRQRCFESLQEASTALTLLDRILWDAPAEELEHLLDSLVIASAKASHVVLLARERHQGNVSSR